MLKDRVCPHIQNTSCPSGFHCWDFNSGCSESTIHFLLCTDKYPLKEHNLSSTLSPVPVHFIFYSHTEFQVILPEKWESLIGTQALPIISIFIWRITPHRPDNLAPLSLYSGLTVGDHQADLIRPERQRRLMSNVGCEWWDNRWRRRLMRCSWEWTTFLASCRPG